MTDKIRVKAHERDGKIVREHERTKKSPAKIAPIQQDIQHGVQRLSRDIPQISKPSQRGQRGVTILGRQAPLGGVNRVSRGK